MTPTLPLINDDDGESILRWLKDEPLTQETKESVMYHPLRNQGIDPNEFPESKVMTIDVLPKWAYTNHPVKLTYDRKEDPNVSLSVVRSKEIEAINEYLASITAGLATANARIAELEAELEAQLAAAQPVQVVTIAPTAQEFVDELIARHGDWDDEVQELAEEWGLTNE